MILFTVSIHNTKIIVWRQSSDYALLLDGQAAGKLITTDPKGYPVLQEAPPVSTTIAYAQRVEALIRKRYSVCEELALHRQRDTKPEEFAAYYDFCEVCKTVMRDEVNELEEV